MINIPCAFHFDTNRTDNIRTYRYALQCYKGI